MTITIRHLSPDEDSRAVHEILAQMSVINGTMRLPYQSLAYTRERLTNKEGVIKLVALIDGRVCGFSELITYPTVARHRHVAEINMIAVHEAWQGQGIGRSLMQAMIDLADQWLQIRKLNLIVWVDNESAVHLYKQLGFLIEGTITEYAFRAGNYIDAYIMGRRLPQHEKVNGHQRQYELLPEVW